MLDETIADKFNVKVQSKTDNNSDEDDEKSRKTVNTRLFLTHQLCFRRLLALSKAQLSDNALASITTTIGDAKVIDSPGFQLVAPDFLGFEVRVKVITNNLFSCYWFFCKYRCFFLSI